MLLFDGDILCYRVAYKTEGEKASKARYSAGSFLGEVLSTLACRFGDSDVVPYQVFLTGKTNFRNDVAVSHEYKANRKDRVKPTHVDTIRKYLIEEWEAIVSDNEEADDLIAIWASDYGDSSCIVSIDKDFDQVPGWHYNFVKKELYYVNASDAMRFLYEQILTGDRVDNIIGLDGIGPVKAKRALEDCTTEREMYDKCVEMYGGDEERVIENARLCFLRRVPEQLWSPPEEEGNEA
jgi:5'-3' exonuclease